jgi:uncharacterized protein YndB with AHSA1/START domain
MSTMIETSLATQVYQVFIKATPEQIWDAITKAEFTEKYFYGSRISFDEKPGGPFVGRGGDGDSVLADGEVLEYDRPRRLQHTWRALYDEATAGEPASRVTWELEAADGGVTKLTVVHDQLEAAPKTAESVAGGWSYILSGLKTLLETGEPLQG